MSKKKSIEALMFTDLHLNAMNKDICVDFFNKLMLFAKQKDVKNIFFLGDFTDNRKGLDEPTITTTLNLFKIIKESNINIYLIPGNHDKFVVSGESSYLDICKYNYLFKNVGICSVGNFDYAFFPYFEGELFDKGIEYFQNLEITKPTILLGHYMYEQIPSEIKNKFEKVFLGHNHEREDFPKGMYLGSCFQQGFSEDNNKGFTILYSDLSTELVPYCFKEFVLQKVDINTFDEEKIKEFILDFKEKNPDKLLKIELNGYNKNISDLKEFCKLNGVAFASKVENNANNIQEEILNISEFSHKQIVKQFENFCEENNVKQEIKDKILNILNNN